MPGGWPTAVAQPVWTRACRVLLDADAGIYRGREELIDHIFVSQALVVKIAPHHVTTDAAGRTPSIDDDPTQR